MAERSEEGGAREAEEAFSFVDKVRFMMYGEQEKEAFLIEKKEKEEKKKAKEAQKKNECKDQKKKQTLFGQIKSFVTGPADHSPKEEKPPPGDSGAHAEGTTEPSLNLSEEPVA